jgi:hypothetical protein
MPLVEATDPSFADKVLEELESQENRWFGRHGQYPDRRGEGGQHHRKSD